MSNAPTNDKKANQLAMINDNFECFENKLLVQL